MKTLNFRNWPLFAAFGSAALLFISSATAQNVGIGVSNPLSRLSVNGTTSSGGLAIGDSTYTSTAGFGNHWDILKCPHRGHFEGLTVAHDMCSSPNCLTPIIF
jgi:hypothetical protein